MIRFFSNFFRRLPPFREQQKAGHASLSTISAQVDDTSGWASLTGRPHDYDPATLQELYADALTAWRKNPVAWRIIAIITDYVVGDRIRISSEVRSLNRFIQDFWHHPQNRLDLRLEEMCDELSRAGDLFALLFRNPQDGMSYLRFVTKDRITKIESAPNDWERELSFTEQMEDVTQRAWLSPNNPGAIDKDAVMLHYTINRPLGALLGESDLTTMIPWLQRYSRMLEDRVRLHWAVRSFLWLVTVPSNMVQAKREQYRTPPEAGSIIVKDESEKWEVPSPSLRGADAEHDLQAVRMMIDAGSGFPPHWRGEPGQANLATATAMQTPTERHLLRRQQYFIFILQDILYNAYQRAVEIGKVRRLSGERSNAYANLFLIEVPDVSRSDNEALARAGRDLAQALQSVQAQLSGRSTTFNKLFLRLVLRFAGVPQPEEALDKILSEVVASPQAPGDQAPSDQDQPGENQGDPP